MKHIFVIFLVCLIAGTICPLDAAIKTFFIEDLCYNKPKATLNLKNENSGILMSVSSSHLSKNFECELTLQTYKESSIVLSIHKYDIVKGDSLTIQDSDRFTIGLIGWATFKDESKFILSNQRIVLNYVKNSSDSAFPSSAFQFTFTEVNEYPSGQCYDDEFQCKNNKCILKSLTCDGHNHCGDNSDQMNCYPITPQTPVSNRSPTRHLYTALIGLCVVAASLLIAILIIFIVVMLRAKSKKSATPSQNQPNAEIALQSVAATPPTQPLTTVNNLEQSSSNPQTQESFFNRFRQSFRNNKKVNEEDPIHQEPIQVPSMYPNLEQAPSAPQYNGEENPSFNAQE